MNELELNSAIEDMLCNRPNGNKSPCRRKKNKTRDAIKKNKQSHYYFSGARYIQYNKEATPKTNKYEKLQKQYFKQSNWWKSQRLVTRGRSNLKTILKNCALYKEDNDLLSHKKDVFSSWEYDY